MVADFPELIDYLVELEVYPFSPLHINFAINFAWVLLQAFKSFMTGASKGEGVDFLGFFSAQILIFLLSFMATLGIFFSLEFWLEFLKFPAHRFLWWLPSVVSIVLAEISNFILLLSPKELETTFISYHERELERKRKQLSVYFFLVVVSLIIFWGLMFWRKK